MQIRPPTRLSTAPVVVLATLGVAACGTSATPSYCAKRGNLEQAVKDVDVSALVSGGPKALRAQIDKVQSEAQAAISAVKVDFPNESSAVQTSVDSLKHSVDALPSQPSPGQIAKIAGDAKGVVTSLQALQTSVAEKCK